MIVNFIHKTVECYYSKVTQMHIKLATVSITIVGINTLIYCTNLMSIFYTWCNLFPLSTGVELVVGRKSSDESRYTVLLISVCPYS